MSEPRTFPWGRLLVGLVVSVAFVGLAVMSLAQRDVTWSEVSARLAGGELGWIAAYFGLLTFLQAVRVVRWGILVRGFGPASWRRITSVGLVGSAAILLLPMKLGELVRPMLIVERGVVRVSEGFASVVVERIIDGVVLSFVFVLTVFALRDWDLPPEFATGAHLTAALFGGAALCLLAAALLRDFADRAIRTMLAPISEALAARVSSAITSFLNAVQLLARRPGRGAAYVFLTVLLWFLTGASLYPIFLAYDLDLPLTASFAVICVMIVGFMIPAGPASTGTFNYAIIVGLSAFGVDDSATGALAILIYLMALLNALLVGVVGIATGSSLRAVIGASRGAGELDATEVDRA